MRSCVVRRACSSALLIAGLWSLASAVHAHAQAAEPDPAPSRKRFSFTPRPGDRCEYFFVTEFQASYTSARAQDPVDRYIFTDSFGLMRNVGRGAVGASLDVSLALGAVRFSPMVRYKRWLGSKQSVESVGHFLEDSPGLVGPIVTARYCPVNYFHLQAGVCQYREQWTVVTNPYNYPDDFEFHDEKTYRVFGGLGFGGIPGVSLWGAQLVGVVILGSFAAAMY
jgi:hypothetical protein